MNKDSSEITKIVRGALAATLLLLVVGLAGEYLADHFEHWAEFGEFVGGTLGAILSLLTIYLVYSNIQIDKKSREKDGESSEFYRLLNNNRDIFKLIVANEFRGNQNGWFPVAGPEAIASILNTQMNSILCAHIAENARREIDILDPFISPLLRKDVFETLRFTTDLSDDQREEMVQAGEQSVFKYLGTIAKERAYEIILRSRHNYDFHKRLISGLSFENNITILKISFKEFYATRGFLFGHYIRNHFYVLSYIDGMKRHNTIEKKWFSDLARSYLSSQELILFFYNCFFEKSTITYRKLLVNYKIFDELNIQEFLYDEFYNENLNAIRLLLLREDLFE